MTKRARATSAGGNQVRHALERKASADKYGEKASATSGLRSVCIGMGHALNFVANGQKCSHLKPNTLANPLGRENCDRSKSGAS